MELFWQEFTGGLSNARELAHVLLRLSAAVLLGAIIGWQREVVGKPAGLRTHMLVTLGTCVFVLACSSSGMSADALSRVVQGIVTGIGFIGAGSILKLNEERNVRGLTTAASIWVAAAIGVAVGLGALGLALVATVFTLLVLAVIGRLERHHQKKVSSNLITRDARE